MQEITEGYLYGYRQNEYLKRSKFSSSLNIYILLAITIYVASVHPWSPIIVVSCMLIVCTNILIMEFFSKCTTCKNKLEEKILKKESMGLIRFEPNGVLEDAHIFVCKNCKLYSIESTSD